MTRRELIGAMAAGTTRFNTKARLAVPVHRVTDRRARCTAEQWHHFWAGIWPEAVREFSQGGIELQATDGPGEIRRSPSDRPIFIGLQRGVINLVVTDHVPMDWDRGRALAGVTTIFDGYHLCLVALRYAHGNRIPFLSVNTCVHELLHALLQDIYVSRPSLYQGGAREFRTDWHATWLWLLGDGTVIRKSGHTYLNRLSSGLPARP